MFTTTFWRDTVERTVASAAGGALTALGLGSIDVFHLDWQVVAGSAAGTGLVSLLKALVASRLNDHDSASLVDLPGRHAADR